ncbi:FAD-dependent monooxygenase [Myceligenerans sp. TRM 65318]|uniref:FAD-dependent monooxygenase n=1 Tax=Myceligenerans pegani TaxID=2776917 RepID=A0ABR9N0V9_9MICO|nr:FAD-dependent monooxygenase [Myceligenerans sp. TRM 65318]MBE3019559.1 FAD-dependent monooxygenase [Myceligenerans sp. TRM 65318]
MAGAGPTGLALACGLRLAGVGVRVVDRAAGPATTSRANFLHARGSEVLDRLGALGSLPDESRRAMSVTTFLGDRPLVDLRFGDPGLRTAAPPMVISQARVEGELRRRLAELGVEPEWGTALVAVEQDDDGVTATLGTGETVRAGWAVGCDGTSSTVRKLAGITAPGVRLSERFLLADVHLDWDLDRTGTTGWIHSTGLIGAMPMPHPDGDLWRILAYDPDGAGTSEGAATADEPTAADHATAAGGTRTGRPRTDGTGGERLGEEQILARVRRILPERTGRTVRVGEPEWLSQFTIHRRLADRYRAGRLFLAGDAAHAHAPFGGQGMLTGLGDAENLAWKLALVVRGAAGDELLDTYEAERRPLAKDVLRGTSVVTTIDVTRNAVGRFVRDRVVAPLFGLPWVQRKATWAASQLWVSYRRGPLGRRTGPAPRPGDRVADLPCLAGDGTPTRLYAHLGGTWAAVVPANGPATTAPAGGTSMAGAGGATATASDTSTGRTSAPGGSTSATAGAGDVVVLRRTDGLDETWLVRPDGHLARRTSGTVRVAGAPDAVRPAAWVADVLGQRR